MGSKTAKKDRKKVKSQRPCDPCIAKTDPCSQHFAGRTLVIHGDFSGFEKFGFDNTAAWQRFLYRIADHRAWDPKKEKWRQLPERIGDGHMAYIFPADADYAARLAVTDREDGSAEIRLPPDPVRRDRLLVRFVRSRRNHLVPVS